MAFIGLNSFKKKSLRILDPSCGNGNFLAACLNNIRYFQNIKEVELWGIDIDAEELKSASRLLKRLKRDYNDEECQITVNLLNRDYFDLLLERDLYLPSNFDILIGNPPYVRHELIRNKTTLRRKMCLISEYEDRNCSRTGSSECKDCNEFDYVNLSSSSDLYCYFLVTATYLLKDQSILLYLVPMKWLQSVYGKTIRRHILNNYCIKKMLHIEKNIFSGVLVDSIIILLKKEAKLSLRNQNQILYGSLDPSKGKKKSSVFLRKGKQVTISQSNLEYENNWYLRLERPPLLTIVMDHEAVVPLDSLPGISIKWGIKTGAENFFYLTKEKSALHSIQDAYKELAIKSPKDLFKQSGNHFYNYLLKIPPIEKKFLSEEVVSYILKGEELNINKRASIELREPWYSLKISDKPDIFIPNFLWNQPLYFFENVERAVVSYNFHSIYVEDKSTVKYLLAFLNSTFGLLYIELLGRKEGGGVLHLQTRDLKEVPVLDPYFLSKTSINSLEDLFIQLSASVPKSLGAIKEIEKIRSMIDLEIATILIGLHKEQKMNPKELVSVVQKQNVKLRSMRTNRKCN